MSDSFFEVIKESEMAPPKRKRAAKTHDTSIRNNTAWFKLPHEAGFCTVPLHPQVQDSLGDAAKDYRQKYPVRQIFTIGSYQVCRDCYRASADLEAADKGMEPVIFE